MLEGKKIVMFWLQRRNILISLDVMKRIEKEIQRKTQKREEERLVGEIKIINVRVFGSRINSGR